MSELQIRSLQAGDEAGRLYDRVGQLTPFIRYSR
jgi:hypothetical protein